MKITNTFYVTDATTEQAETRFKSPKLGKCDSEIPQPLWKNIMLVGHSN